MRCATSGSGTTSATMDFAPNCFIAPSRGTPVGRPASRRPPAPRSRVEIAVELVDGDGEAFDCVSEGSRWNGVGSTRSTGSDARICSSRRWVAVGGKCGAAVVLDGPGERGPARG